MDRQRAASIDGSDSLEGDGLPFYPSQSPSLRRSMGCGRQSNKVPAAEDVRPREVDVRGTDKDAGRGRSRPQLEANRGRQRRTKRQSDRNPWALHRRQRKQGWLIESFSQAIHAESTLLGTTCLHSRGSRQSSSGHRANNERHIEATVKLAPLPFEENVASNEACKGEGVATDAL